MREVNRGVGDGDEDPLERTPYRVPVTLARPVSDEALETLRRIFPGSAGLGRLRQLLWNHNDDIDVDSIWGNAANPQGWLAPDRP